MNTFEERGRRMTKMSYNLFRGKRGTEYCSCVKNDVRCNSRVKETLETFSKFCNLKNERWDRIMSNAASKKKLAVHQFLGYLSPEFLSKGLTLLDNKINYLNEELSSRLEPNARAISQVEDTIFRWSCVRYFSPRIKQKNNYRSAKSHFTHWVPK